MPIHIVGLNHSTAPVEVRERLSFGPDVVVGALRSALRQTGAREGAILSTCNRTELYAVGDADLGTRLGAWACQFHEVSPERVNPYLYRHTDDQAVQHLLAVSCGLDSLVLGEPQILGQVKNAYQTARGAGSTGKLLERLFQHAFATAKQVRTDTGIGDSPVSVAFAAVNLARQIFADLSEQTALLIGAGETIELAARHLHQQGVKRMIVANRTVERAHGLASQFDGYAIALSEMGAHLAEADIVISSTASPVPVLGKGAVESALKQRRHRPMFLVDIAVPRDIEPEVAQLSDAYLYTVDDLEEVIQENLESRQQAAQQAREIIELQVTSFNEWLGSLDAVDLIQGVRTQAENERDLVLSKAMRMINAGKAPEEALAFLANTLTQKLLHIPSSQLRDAGSQGRQDLLEAANTLFGLAGDKNKS